MPDHLPPWTLALAGALLCVAGWLLYRVSLRIVGFILGALIGAMVGFTFSVVAAEFGYSGYSTIIIAACALLLGLINAYLFYKLYLVGIFIICSIAGYLVLSGPDAVVFLERFNLPDAAWVPFAGGLLIGAGMLLLHRYVVIVLTSLAGSGLLMAGLQIEEHRWLFVAFLIGGILIQLGLLNVFKIKPGLRRRIQVEED